MTNPTVASSSMTAQGMRSAPFLGRVELLDDLGAVLSSWDVPIGRYSLGSGPECPIRIQDGSIDSVHLILTIGKKYTLLKAVGAARIGGRPIREWLIDQSTLIDLGGRSVVIHPNAARSISVVTSDRLSEIASRLAAYGAPRPVSEDIDQSAVPHANSQPLVPPSDPATSEALADIKKNVEALSEALAGIKEQIPTVHSFDSLLERVQETAVERLEQSIDARLRALDQRMQETTGEAQRDVERMAVQLGSLVRDQESLRGQLAHLEDLQHSLADKVVSSQSNAIQILPASGETPISGPQVPAALLEAEPEVPASMVVEMQSNFLSEATSEQVDLPVDNDSISMRLDRMLYESSERRTSIPSVAPYDHAMTERLPSTESGFEEPMSDSFPAVRDMDPASIYTALPECEGTPAPYRVAEDAPQNESPQNTEDSNSESEASYQNDVASIRGNGVSSWLDELSPSGFDFSRENDGSYAGYSEASYEPNPSNPTHDAFASDAFASDPIASDPIARVEAIGDFIVDESLQDIDALHPRFESDPLLAERSEPTQHDGQLPSYDIESTVEAMAASNAYVLPAEELGLESPEIVDTTTTSEMDDDSIEQYMQRLLQRVRSGSSDTNHSAIIAPSASSASSSRAPDSKDRNLSAIPLSTNPPSGSGRVRSASESMGPAQVRTAQEAKSDLELLREIANSNARRAINRSVLRRKSSNLIVKVTVVMISLVCATAMLMMNGLRVNATLFGTVAALVVAVLWGVDSLKEYQSILVEKQLRTDSEPAPNELL